MIRLVPNRLGLQAWQSGSPVHRDGIPWLDVDPPTWQWPRRLRLVSTPKPPTLPPDFAALRARQIADARTERRRLNRGPYDREAA